MEDDILDVESSVVHKEEEQSNLIYILTIMEGY